MQNNKLIELYKLNNPNLNLDPYFVRGLIEAEGSFSVTKHKYIRDLSLMVIYETFNLCYMGSNPIGLKNYIFKYYLFIIII